MVCYPLPAAPFATIRNVAIWFPRQLAGAGPPFALVEAHGRIVLQSPFGSTLQRREMPDYARAVSRGDPLGDRFLLPFPSRAVHGRRGVAGEACSMIEHRPLSQPMRRGGSVPAKPDLARRIWVKGDPLPSSSTYQSKMPAVSQPGVAAFGQP
jgi:hypothetical protein